MSYLNNNYIIKNMGQYTSVWKSCKKYLRARKNDIHIPLSYHWCQKLLTKYKEADQDVCSLAIILHDIGWYCIDIEKIIKDGFRSKNYLQSKVRFMHEKEGVNLSKVILKKSNWEKEIIYDVCDIIDGHDTRNYPKSLNDRIVRDADKLWRYSVTGIAIASDWLGVTPSEYIRKLNIQKNKLETEYGYELALKELEISKENLMAHII